MNSVTYTLAQPPRVFTVQLTWESHSEQPASIAATLAATDEQVGCTASRRWRLWGGNSLTGARP